MEISYLSGPLTVAETSRLRPANIVPTAPLFSPHPPNISSQQQQQAGLYTTKVSFWFLIKFPLSRRINQTQFQSQLSPKIS